VASTTKSEENNHNIQITEANRIQYSMDKLCFSKGPTMNILIHCIEKSYKSKMTIYVLINQEFERVFSSSTKNDL
jgi:hypothetical protein